MDAGGLRDSRPRADCGGFDLFRPLAAALVVMIHTGPLLSVNPQANYLFTDILARLAVPFFFAVSGYLLAPRLRAYGAAALRAFLKKLLLLYGASILLYLPLMLYSGYFQAPGLGWKLLRDILFDGPFYHLWYFPAAALGACFLFLCVRRLNFRFSLALCALLYLIGLLGDSYYGLAAALPPLHGLYEIYFALFSYTRNGLFFAPLFFLLGGALARCPGRRRPACYAALFCGSLTLLAAEGMLVRRFALARHDSMYLTLPICLWLLLRALEVVKLKPLPALRTLSTVVYIIHPLCIVGVRLLGKLFHVLSSDGFLFGSSLLHYLAVVCASCAAALPFLLLRPRRRDGRTRAWAEIDRSALTHNVRALRALLPEDCGLMAVVKADAYGHGASLVARTCMDEGVTAFAVASAEEGAALRRSGIKGEILVLGYTAPALAPLLARYALSQAVNSAAYARALEAEGRRLRVHLAVDTGMHRLGIPWDDIDSLASAFTCRHLKPQGMFTHFADAERCCAHSDEFTLEQLRRFQAAAQALRGRGLEPGKLHVQGSYGLLNYPAEGGKYRYARVGIALYGLLSNEGDHTRALPELRPVLSLRARVAQVRSIPAGESAGYDGRFVARRPTQLATVTIGYADGYPRALSQGVGTVLIRGQRAPVAGLICMDQLLVDVTGIPDAEAGDVVTLIGRDGDETLTAGEVAGAAGTITNELLSRLGPRVARIPAP